jgi:hypothetical protein
MCAYAPRHSRPTQLVMQEAYNHAAIAACTEYLHPALPRVPKQAKRGPPGVTCYGKHVGVVALEPLHHHLLPKGRPPATACTSKGIGTITNSHKARIGCQHGRV